MKKIERGDYHVEVWPRMYQLGGCLTEAEEKAECERIVDEIRRHVAGKGVVEVKWTTTLLCEHCSSHWTEPSDAYNGGCCDEDEKNNPEANR